MNQFGNVYGGEVYEDYMQERQGNILASKCSINAIIDMVTDSIETQCITSSGGRGNPSRMTRNKAGGGGQRGTERGGEHVEVAGSFKMILMVEPGTHQGVMRQYAP